MSLSIKNKLLSLTLLPVLMLSIVMIGVMIRSTAQLNSVQVERTQDLLLAEKREVLKALMNVVVTAVKPIYDQGLPAEEAIKYMREISYPGGGYIFGYSDTGVRIFNGSNTAGVGNSYWDLKDVNNVYLIRDLVSAGKKNGFGDGNEFVQYHFPRLGEKTPLPKLSFSTYFPNWNMMVGTGFYIDDVDATVQTVRDDIDAARQDIIMSMVIITVLLALCAGIVGYFVKGSIINPILGISDSIQKLAAGGGDLTQRIKSKDQHEIGCLATNLNSLLHALQDIISKVKTVAQDVKNETSTMADRADTISDVTNQQHSESDLVANAVAQMAETATVVASSSERASDAAKQADESRLNGLETVKASSVAMSELVSEINRAQEVIAGVGSEVDNISGILQVIETIAEQTNLLALNAAIEAARAGEQGRGFAVVADEVRSLASKTRQSTEEIKQMIGKLQEGSKAAVSVMEVSTGKSATAEQRVQETSQALDTISGAVQTISDMNSQIAHSAIEQQRASDEINQRIAAISGHVTKMSEVADQNGQGYHLLTSKTQELDDVVGQFKV
ncbi:methyl-accepting chemotaxis protein [Agarilytica rhodophyticola]|uniref:methyl-accepting chemotaxis protein n=1 Tax=Agarilytica rhodophyticola TaxID=1737490 RepID=UPI000B341A1A|nr:methyl-accepting chemotaxis protein [Agarilytica rhodophyticola]